MKQKLLSLMLLLCALIAGSTSVWADTVTFSYGDYKGQGTSSSGSEYTMVKSNVSIKDTKFYGNNSHAHFYAGGTTTITPGTGVTITQIELTASSTSYNGYQSSGTVTASNGSISGSTSSTTVTWTGSATSSFTISHNKQIRWTSIVVTYTVAAPAYTITAQSNNNSYGTVSLSGSVITGSPNSGYRYASPAYSVSPANSATVLQNGNAFTVTPSANTTVTINFEAIPTYTVTFSDGGSVTEATGGAGVTLPSRYDVGSYTFAGWSTTNVPSETTTAPTIIPVGTYHPTDNITLYPVYTKAGGGAAAPSAFSVGDTGDYAIVSAEQGGKYYALPTNPTVSSGKITAQEITVSETDGVKYVTTANANGFTWTIAAATNGYTLSDGTKYIYHSNGGSSGTNVTYGTSTDFTWAFTADGDYVKMYGMSGSTTNTRGLLFSGTTIGGYALSNWGANGYHKTMILPVAAGATIYYWSSPVAATVERPDITIAENPFYISTTATITCETEGASIKYSYDNSTWNDYSSALTITESKTIYAKAVKGENESTVASVTATKNLATPTVTVSGDLTVDLAGETNVNAGTLTAAVTYNDAAVAGATVTWSSSDTDVATIDATTGAVALLTTGSVTFTATYAGNSDYAEATGTKTVTVVNNDPNAITLWSEDFSSYSAEDVPGGGTYSYACTNGGGTTKIYNQTSTEGGQAPELLVGRNGGTFTAQVPLNNATGTLTLTYKTNAKSMTVSTTTDGITGGGTFNAKETHTVTFTGVESKSFITIVFTSGSDNVRLDDILLRGSAQVATVEAPTFSVNGGTYYTVQSVELSCATDGATIYYTTNGDEPTSSSTEYASAITVSETMTIKAIAIKGSDQSSVSSATYTISEKNDVVFSIDDKSIAYGETYTVTKGSYTGRDIQTDGYVTVSTDNAAVASVSGMTITAEAVGTATITLSVAEGDTYKAGSTTITVTVTAPEGQITAPEVPALFNETFASSTGSNDSFSGSDGNGTFTADNTGWTKENAYGAGGAAKFGTGSKSGSARTPELTVTVGTTYTLTFKAAPWSTDNTTMTVAVDGGTINSETTVVSSAMTTGEWNEFSYDIVATSTTMSIGFSASQRRFFLDEVRVVAEGATAAPITATLNGSGYATFCSQYPLDFSDYATADYSAWQITNADKNTGAITFTQITGSVKGGTGILLKGTAGETITLASADSDNELDDNMLVGTLAPQYFAAEAIYGLAGNTFKLNNAGTFKANKAYIPAGQLGNARAFTFVFVDPTTGITETQNVSAEEFGAIFNLAGQRVSQPQRGVNIINGKKVLVK